MVLYIECSGTETDYKLVWVVSGKFSGKVFDTKEKGRIWDNSSEVHNEDFFFSRICCQNCSESFVLLKS